MSMSPRQQHLLSLCDKMVQAIDAENGRDQKICALALIGMAIEELYLIRTILSSVTEAEVAATEKSTTTGT